ncbi:uncharacterized protein LOC144639848 isoform X2 [Oculina patagonica]
MDNSDQKEKSASDEMERNLPLSTSASRFESSPAETPHAAEQLPGNSKESYSFEANHQKKLPLETEDSCSALIHISKKRLSEEEKTSGKSLLDNSSDDVTGQFPEEARASFTASASGKRTGRFSKDSRFYLESNNSNDLRQRTDRFSKDTGFYVQSTSNDLGHSTDTFSKDSGFYLQSTSKKARLSKEATSSGKSFLDDSNDLGHTTDTFSKDSGFYLQSTSKKARLSKEATSSGKSFLDDSNDLGHTTDTFSKDSGFYLQSTSKKARLSKEANSSGKSFRDALVGLRLFFGVFWCGYLKSVC